MKNDLISIGKIVKLVRKDNKLSQQDLGNLVGVDQATVSRIEKGNINITFEVYSKVLKGLNISLDLKNDNLYEELFLKLIEAIEKYDYIHINEIYNESPKNNLINYYQYHIYKLFNAFYYLAIQNIQKLKECINELQNYLYLYDDYYLMKLNFLFGQYYILIHEYEKSLPYFEEAYYYCEVNDILDGLLYYHYAWANYLLLNHTTSILTIEKARVIYNKKNNEIRLYGLLNLFGMIHINDGNFLEAEKIFLNCLNNHSFISKEESNYYFVLRNLALSNFYSNNYDMAIYYLEILYQKEKFRTKTVIFFLLLVMKLSNNNDKFIMYYNDCKEIKDDKNIIKKIINIFSYDDLYTIFNNSLVKDLELIISKYNIYPFTKWMIDNSSKEIYSLRKYSTYKNLLDNFLKLKVE